MAKTYRVIMRQVLFDIGVFEAESEEEAIDIASNHLDPEEIEDNFFDVLQITDENGNVVKGVDEYFNKVYGKEA